MNERLRELRKKCGLSQEEFGKKLGVTKTAVSKMELGTYQITDTMLKLICSEFNVNEKWLRSGERRRICLLNHKTTLLPGRSIIG
ncbi:MAG: helix-turn-helix domain-containing protein [Enterocloster aldenensis]